MRHRNPLLALALAMAITTGNLYAGSPEVCIIPSIEGIGNSQLILPFSSPQKMVDNGRFSVITTGKLRDAETRKAPARSMDADEALYKVEVTCKFDPNKYMIVGTYCYDNEALYSEYPDWMTNITTFELPAGTYDFLTTAYRFDYETLNVMQGMALMVKEQIEVSENMTLEFDFDEITKCIKVEPYLSNGEKAEPCTIKYTDSEFNFEFIERGNCADVNINKQLFCEGKLIWQGIINSSCNVEAGEFSKPWVAELATPWYINEVSDRYTFNNLCTIISLEGDYRPANVCEIRAVGTSMDKMTNEGAKYFNDPISYYMDHSPRFFESPATCENPYGVVFQQSISPRENNLMGSVLNSGLSSHNPNNVYNINYCPDKSVELPVSSCLQFQLADYTWEQTFEYGPDDIEVVPYSIYLVSRNIMPESADNYLNQYEAFSDCFQCTPEGEGVRFFIEPMEFSLKDCDMVAGNNMPYLLSSFLYAGLDEDGKPAWNYFCQFYGQLGERRNTDSRVAEVEINADENNPMHVNFSFVDKNILIDDMLACNTNIVDIDYSKDTCIPAFTALQCRNSEGRVTDRYENASDGVITFTAGGFDQIDLGVDDWGYLKWGFEYMPVGVKVEYAPHGTESWSELETVEHPDKLMPYGVGTYYTCALTPVDKASETKWYDARVTLTTENGNNQVQTFSPLFRIDNPTSGIDPMWSEGTANPVYYNLWGTKIPSPQPGVNIIRYPDGSTKKVIVSEN